MKRNPDSLQILATVKTWAKGFKHYPLESDLVGKIYRHPHMKITFYRPDGTTLIRMAYDVAFKSSGTDVGMGAVTDGLEFDALGGIDNDNGDHGQPIYHSLAAFRTGSASHVTMAGSFATPGDCVARFGLPWVVRRNLVVSSGDHAASMWEPSACSISTNADIGPFGDYRACKVTNTPGSGYHYRFQRNITLKANQPYTKSFCAKPGSLPFAYCFFNDNSTNKFAYFNLLTGTVGYVTAGLSAAITLDKNGYYRCTLTYTPTVDGTTYMAYGLCKSDNAGSYTAGSNDYGFIDAPQMEPGSTATPYQPTNATGVDLINPINGAGLVLEGAGTNLGGSDTSFENGLDGWIEFGTSTPVSSSDTFSGWPRHGTKSLKLSPLNSGEGVRKTFSALTIGAWYTVSVDVNPATGFNFGIRVCDSLNATTQFQTYTSTQNRISLSFQAIETSHVIRLCKSGDGGTLRTGYFDCLKFEASPFMTSWHDGTRSPDQCAVVEPHNYSDRSDDFSHWERLSEAKAVVINAAPDPFGGNTADQLEFTGTSAVAVYRKTLTIPGSLAGKTISFPVWLKAGTATGVTLRIDDQNNSTIGSAIPMDLTTTMQRYFVPVTCGAGVTQIKLVFRARTTGTFFAYGHQANDGLIPGPYVQTQDTPILPSGITTDQAFWQNGAIEFDVVLPTISTGKNYNIIGSGTPWASPYVEALDLYRAAGTAANSHSINLVRKHNGTTGQGAITGRGLITSTATLFDGAKHRVRLEWSNYVLAGVRYMWLKIYIDGTLAASQDVAALYGATAWIAPERLWLSDGNVFATLGDVVPSYLPLPDGATT
jgi:hypothetical protein